MLLIINYNKHNTYTLQKMAGKDTHLFKVKSKNIKRELNKNYICCVQHSANIWPVPSHLPLMC